MGWVGLVSIRLSKVDCISVYFFFTDIFVVASCGSLHFKNNSHFIVRARIGKVRLYQARSARIIFIIVPCDQTGSFFLTKSLCTVATSQKRDLVVSTYHASGAHGHNRDKQTRFP